MSASCFICGTDRTCERCKPTTVLLPAENMALTVARAQVSRGEAPPLNTATVLVMALDRLTSGGRS